MNCDVCGDNLTVENVGELLHGNPDTEDLINVGTMIGIQITVEGVNHPVATKMKEIFGKTDFSVCHCCWLKSLGVKPVGSTELQV